MLWRKRGKVMFTVSGWIKTPKLDFNKPVFSIRGNNQLYEMPYNPDGSFAAIISPVNVAGSVMYKYRKTEDGGYLVKGKTQIVLGGRNFDLRIGQLKREAERKLIGKKVEFLEV